MKNLVYLVLGIMFLITLIICILFPIKYMGGNNTYSNSWSKYEHRIATINFQFDDGSEKDAEIYNIFKEHNMVCGFALLSNNKRQTQYLKYQREGFEILSHSIDGDVMNDSLQSIDIIEDKILKSKQELVSKGFNIRGWVTPSSQMNDIYIPILRKYYDYGYTQYYGVHEDGVAFFDKDADLFRLSRVSLENTTLENQIKAVDQAISNNGFLTFYGHASGLDSKNNNETKNNLNKILNYIEDKQTKLQCYVLKPSDAIDYYFHVRHCDYLDIKNKLIK